MTKVTNRPIKLGAGDRQERIVQDSETALRVINDTNGNAIFLGRATVGSEPARPRWQIRKMVYDSNSAVTAMLWPEDSENNASNDFEFYWSLHDDLDISTISQANPAVVEVLDIENLQNGDKIIIQGVTGMTEVNFDGTNIYTVANILGNTFELQGVNSSGYTAYSSGGTVFYGSAVNYTYS